MNQPISICICILTFRRPGRLRAAIESIQEQTLLGNLSFELTGLVVDNDANRTGEAVTREFSHYPIPFRYAVEENRGIVCGRNRVLQEAGNSDFLALLDDDETATPEWLERLFETQREFNAGVVTGPVDFILEDPPPWVLKGRFFSPRRYTTGSSPKYVETNNILISGALARRYRFDMRFNDTSGEDTYFFRQIAQDGGTIVWCEDARVNESVGPNRTTSDWLIERERSSSNRLTRCYLYGRPGIGTAVMRVLRGLASLGLGAFLLLTSLGSKARAVKGRQRVGRFLGTVSALRGASHVYYKRDTPLS